MHRCCCELGPKSAQLLGMYSWDVGGGDGIGQHIVVTLGSAVVHLCLSSGHRGIKFQQVTSRGRFSFRTSRISKDCTLYLQRSFYTLIITVCGSKHQDFFGWIHKYNCVWMYISLVASEKPTSFRVVIVMVVCMCKIKILISQTSIS